MNWATITQPQATILSGGLTCLGALAAVFLAWRLLSGKVTNLRDAVRECEDIVRNHRGEVERALGDIIERLKILDIQAASTLQSLGTIGDTVSDIQPEDAEAAPGDAPDAEGDRQVEDAPSPRERFGDHWSAIRDAVEGIAADQDIDGRTRARYGRIDRRNYLDLVDALADDGLLSVKQAEQVRRAVKLRHRFKNGRRSPGETEVDEMGGIRRAFAA